jgi:Glycosyl hydrolases family 16
MTEIPDPVAGLTLAFEDDFLGSQIDERRWVPYYLPHWSSRERTAARLGRHDGRLALQITADQPPWCPEWDGELRASVLQTGLYAGAVGSGDGQLHFRPDLVVREEQTNRLTFAPHGGYVELRAKAVADPAVMVALWMCGVEDRPERCGEICIAEIFGSDVAAAGVKVGMGIKAFADPLLVEEFSADQYPIDATEFHTYAASWGHEGVEFLLDGDVVKRTAQSPSYPMQLMLAIYEFPDRIDPSRAVAYPKAFVVDAVRGYVRP